MQCLSIAGMHYAVGDHIHNVSFTCPLPVLKSA